MPQKEYGRPFFAVVGFTSLLQAQAAATTTHEESQRAQQLEKRHMTRRVFIDCFFCSYFEVFCIYAIFCSSFLLLRSVLLLLFWFSFVLFVFSGAQTMDIFLVMLSLQNAE